MRQLRDPVERALGSGRVSEGELEEAQRRQQLEARRMDADPLRELDALVDPRPGRLHVPQVDVQQGRDRDRVGPLADLAVALARLVALARVARCRGPVAHQQLEPGDGKSTNGSECSSPLSSASRSKAS